ncbi:thymidylate kinase [Vibrio sp. AH4]|nr:thymidylate kinase [Vibrio sp. AH4]MDP4491925.1 thymidylate kinase [Vibrio sp. AH4]
MVEFRHQMGGFVLLTDEKGEECRYVDLDSASQSAMAVGFRQVRVEQH